MDAVEIAFRETFRFGKERVAIEPIRPEVGDADFELVFSLSGGVGNIDPKRRQPDESELPAIERDFGNLREVAELKKELLLVCQ